MPCDPCDTAHNLHLTCSYITRGGRQRLDLLRLLLRLATVLGLDGLLRSGGMSGKFRMAALLAGREEAAVGSMHETSGAGRGAGCSLVMAHSSGLASVPSLSAVVTVQICMMVLTVHYPNIPFYSILICITGGAAAGGRGAFWAKGPFWPPSRRPAAGRSKTSTLSRVTV
eukprot:COSAG04_NODE_129_length_24418_cov_207.438217_17_plen_170_part_00